MRLIAYDPESCREFVITIDHYDTSTLLAAYVRVMQRVGKKEGEALHFFYCATNQFHKVEFVELFFLTDYKHISKNA